MLARLFRSAPPVEERETISLAGYSLLRNQAAYGVTYSPIPVTVQRALTHAASSACIDVLATSVSETPLDVIRPVGASRVPVDRVPSLLRDPSAFLTVNEWVYQFADAMLTDGNGFGVITAVDSLGAPTGIEPISSTRVGDRRIIDGVKTATVDGVRWECYPHGDLWHLPGKMRDGQYFADSLVARAAATIGGAIAARDFGARYFGDGGHPGGILKKTDGEEASEPQAKAVKQAFMNAVKGTREPAVLGGWDYTPILTGENVGAEGLALMQFAIEEACRFWRVPPAMVYASISGQNVTYANASQADIHYLKYSVEWLFQKFEKHLFKLVPGKAFVRFNRKAFLQSDAPTRGDYLDKRLRNKTISVNEYRALEDEPPFDGDEWNDPGIPGGPTDAPPDPSAAAAGGS